MRLPQTLRIVAGKELESEQFHSFHPLTRLVGQALFYEVSVAVRPARLPRHQRFVHFEQQPSWEIGPGPAHPWSGAEVSP